MTGRWRCCFNKQLLNNRKKKTKRIFKILLCKLKGLGAWLKGGRELFQRTEMSVVGHLCKWIISTRKRKQNVRLSGQPAPPGHGSHGEDCCAPTCAGLGKSAATSSPTAVNKRTINKIWPGNEVLERTEIYQPRLSQPWDHHSQGQPRSWCGGTKCPDIWNTTPCCTQRLLGKVRLHVCGRWLLIHASPFTLGRPGQGTSGSTQAWAVMRVFTLPVSGVLGAELGRLVGCITNEFWNHKVPSDPPHFT